MKVIYKIGNIKIAGNRTGTVAAIGIFDGVHLGHQYLIKAMLRKAKALKAAPMVVTFFPHPAHILAPHLKLAYLTSLSQRLELLVSLGVEICVVVPFTRKFAQVQPEYFIRDILVKKLQVRAVFVGEDFKFGRDRAGDVPLFKKLAPVYGYQMRAMPALTKNGKPVSSTRVRQLLAEGSLPWVQKLLGRPFALVGRVVKGSGRGKQIGFPTANVSPLDKKCLLPGNGIYAVRVLWNNKILAGAANVGVRPSFKEKNPSVHLEVYILDFSKNLYGQELEVQFVKRVRNEQKFSSVPKLIAQIHKDVAKIRRILK
jgi:riboflavin kinase/FMN adenylyltransferase